MTFFKPQLGAMKQFVSFYMVCVLWPEDQTHCLTFLYKAGKKMRIH